MCDVCASTLKKNQVKNHFSQCRSRNFTCVDCSKSLTGQELDAHTVCISEAEKYFGKFYQGKNEEKKGNGGKAEQKGEKTGDKEKINKNKGDKEKKGKVEKWKGWKNEIKNVLKEQSDGIEERKLKKIVVKRFVECGGVNSELDEVFDMKVGFRRFVKKDDKVYYYRFLKE